MSAADAVVPLPYSPAEAESALGPRWRETLLAMYRWMALGRALDARMQGLQRQGRVGFYGAATGQEGVSVAAGLATGPDDWILPGLREQLVALVRGHSLVTYAHHLFADDRDPARGRNMPCHPTAGEVHYVSMSSVIGTQISHAVGVAYGMRARGSHGVALAFFGDGATSANDFHAGLNLAAVWNLPVIFCCTNNQWAISLPVERQSAVTTLAVKGAAYGIPSRRVDGTDVIAVHRALSEALGSARAGNGPTFLEFLVFRMTPHSSSDDPGRYQPKDWSARAESHDPFLRLTSWLSENGLLDAESRARITAAAEEEVRAAVRAAEETTPPSPSSLTEDVYAPVGSLPAEPPAGRSR
ncbi:MAG TPA: thiamine pyrophosphate-dependent enzyme [Thermoplasmata archaeon]|nr:thiamine pyrophosphate-dependent enzyme [Thermoplasmata archaeon]